MSGMGLGRLAKPVERFVLRPTSRRITAFCVDQEMEVVYSTLGGGFSPDTACYEK